VRQSLSQLRRLEKAFQTIIDDARDQVVRRVEARGTSLVAAADDGPPGHVPRADTLMDANAWAASVRAEVGPVMEDMIVDAANRVAAGYAFTTDDPRMVLRVKKHVDAVESWGEDLRANVAASVERGVAEGWSVQRIADDLQERGVFSDKTALSVARTQAVAASNGGTYEAWQVAGIGSKTWASSGDGRVRPTHMDADGQTVSLNDTFTVGGFDCMYPGDPDLPDEEAINCRCTMYADQPAGAPEIDPDTGEVIGAPTAAAPAEPGFPDVVTQTSPPLSEAASIDRGHGPALTAAGRVPFEVVDRATGQYAQWMHFPSAGPLQFAEDAPGSDGAMIALAPTAEAAAAMVQPDGLAAEDLHVTLYFLGQAADLDEAQAMTAMSAAESAAADQPPIEANVAGCGLLGDAGAVVLFLNAEVDGLRAKLDDGLQGMDLPEQHPNYICHLTLGYAPDDPTALLEAGQALMGTTFVLDHLIVSIGDQDMTYELAQAGATEENVTLTLNQNVRLGYGSANSTTGNVEYAPAPDGGGGAAPTGAPTGAAVTEGHRFADAAELEPGLAVQWVDADGNDATGTVVDITGLDSDPQTVTVAPDDGTDPVEVPIGLLEVVETPAGDQGTPPPAGAPAPAAASTMTWEGLLVVEGVPSGDMRTIEVGALTWRDLPLPLFCMFKNPEGGMGHAGAVSAGTIDEIWRTGENDAEVWGRGRYSDTASGRAAFAAAADQSIRGISVDLDNVEADLIPLEGQEGDDYFDAMLSVTAARVMGATQTAFAAFAETHIEVPAEGEALVASAGAPDDYHPEMRIFTMYDGMGGMVASAGDDYPEYPPVDWFAKPAPDVEMAGVRVDEDGRVHGFAAEEGTCHIGFRDRCVPVPHSVCDYAEFRESSTLCDDGKGGRVLVSTGPVMYDTVHPDLKMTASDTKSFYAHTGSEVADVAVYDIPGKGMYIAGAVRPGASPAAVRALRGGSISPDWRYSRKYRNQECQALLAVNCSGFKVTPALVASAGDGAFVLPGSEPRAHIDGTGRVLSLVAAGALPASTVDELRREVAELRSLVGDLSDVVRPIRRERVLARIEAQFVREGDAPEA
jgi:2'-5' RNA ligase